MSACGLAGFVVIAGFSGTVLAGAAAQPPDERAARAGEDANLEPTSFSGMTFAAAIGGGIVLGDGVGSGPAVSVRVGHVATPWTAITFELTGGSLIHRDAVSGNTPLYHDDDYNVMAGGLTYIAPSLWLRGAGGLSVLTTDGAMGTKPHPGVAGLFGVGVDLVHWGALALGLESWAMLSVVTTRGLVFDSGLCIGLSYY